MLDTESSVINRDSELDGARALALLRWKRGHRAFHFILEGMINLSQSCRRSLQSGNHRSLSQRLEELAGLFQSATAAFKYAAAFDAELYAKVVRPTMMPPYVPAGFSGSLNGKHDEMTQALQRLQKDLSGVFGRQWPEPVKQAWDDVLRAKGENLRNHGLICSQFVPGGQSLLRDYYSQQAKGSSADD
ncbi:MAG: hypothetical protein ACREBG_17755 [Pyrinomonadaceae bacterium]